MDEVEEEIQDHLVMESQATTLHEGSQPSSYEIVDLSPEIPDSDEELEYSDDDEPDDVENCTVTAETPSPIARIITLIAEDAGAVFPVIEGKRRLHPHRFERLLEKIRGLMWNYRQVNVDWDAYSYVLDRPPIGSKFDAKTGGYTAPDGVAISRTMRERVKIIKQRYKEIQEIQEKWFNDDIGHHEMRNECVKALGHWPIVEPDTTLTPVWRGMTLGHMKTTTRGPVHARVTQGKVVFSPKKQGPLHWEVSLEDSSSPTYFSKN